MASYVLHLAPALAYAGLALLVAGEAAGLPLPGETSLAAAALLAADRRLSLPLVVGIASAAAVAGDNLGYVAGRKGIRTFLLRGRRLADRRRDIVERSERFFERRGALAVFVGRWVPWLRVTVAWLAGTARMPWPSFLLWNAAGAILWATSVGLAVYLLGGSAGHDLALLGRILVAGLVLGLLVAVVAYRRRRSSGDGATVSRAGRDPSGGRSALRRDAAPPGRPGPCVRSFDRRVPRRGSGSEP